MNATIKMSFQQLVEVVNQLSPIDKIKLNEVIWSDNTTIPIEHQKFVLDRITKSKQKPEMMLDWDEENMESENLTNLTAAPISSPKPSRQFANEVLKHC